MDISARVEVRYLAPPASRLGDVLRLLRSATWVAFMARHIAPRLERVSPADARAVEQLGAAGRRERCDECVICMDAGEDEDEDGQAARPAAELPCGHAFHHDCIHSWLQLQSTCPVCRWQLPKAFAGRYAVRALSSVVMLDSDVAAMPWDQLPAARVGGRYVRTVVTVLLAKVDNLAHERPCMVSAHVADGRTGAVFTAVGPTRVLSTARVPGATQWKLPIESALRTQCGSPAILPPLTDVLGRRKRLSRVQDESTSRDAVSKRRRSS